MMSIRNEERIYFRAKQPNPLFCAWLEQWLQEAEKKDSMKRHVLAKALESIKKYPLVLYSGRECAILEGFGPGICAMLDKQLAMHRGNNPDCSLDEQDIEIKERTILQEVKSILEEKRKEPETAEEKWKLPENLDDTLEALYRKYDNMDEFDDLVNKKPNRKAQEKVTNTKAPEEVTKAAEEIDVDEFMPPKVVVPAGSFKIVLLVDTQETAGKSKRSLDATIQSLEKHKVTYEVRRLSVGDFLWICRDTRDPSVELVLPYVVERKRMDDLASSIKDGRFHEQKFRLTDCGLANKIYLIENRGSNMHLGLPLQNLLQAATNTQVHSKFSNKFTDSINDSMFYLTVMTNLLIKMFKDKDLSIAAREELDKLPRTYYEKIDLKTEIQLMAFNDFAENSTKMKNFTIRDLFMRQLVQLKTLSIDKAVAITEVYPTPRDLILAYRKCANKHEAMNLLADIRFGIFKKPIGAPISQALYNLYSL